MGIHEIILLLILGLIVCSYTAYYYYKQNKINYSNYQMALRALADADPKLRIYLAKKDLMQEEI